MRIHHLFRPFFGFFVKWTAAEVGHNLHVNGWSKVTSKTALGNAVNFNGMKIVGHGNVKIGHHFHSGKNCMILTDVHNYDNGTKIPYDEVVISKDVMIEDNVWIGYGVIILGGVTLGEGCIVQAGSVVAKSIPKYAIAGGHPAVPFKQRNIEHYEELKRQGQFF